MQSKAIRSRSLARRAATSAVLSLLVGSSGGVAAASLTPADGLPLSGGLVTELDLGRLGYEGSEFFVEGTAHSYHDVPGTPFTNDGMWTVEADVAPTPGFKTRIHVAKPTDPSRFNGTVYVEWMNVSSLRDGPAAWGVAHVEFARQGAAYVGVSAQAVGVNSATTDFPERYGPAGANLVHPGDSYSYDIFSQAGQALRQDAEIIFGLGYPVSWLIATGESQSAGRLVTYVNAFAESPGIFDGYFLHSRGDTGAALRGDVAGPPALAEIATPENTLIRTDLTVPVFTFQTETDSREVRQDDSALLRWWEVAGTAHADASFLVPGLAATDYGTSSRVAEQLFDLMLHPTSQATAPGFPLPPCNLGINAGPHYWVVKAAYRRLSDWVANGTPPPIADRLATEGGSPTGALILDEHGNATGGIRSPHVDVPVATLRGSGNSPGFCSLFGSTVPFSAETLARLYRSQGAFVSRWRRSTDATVRAGFFRAEDARWVKVSAAKSRVVIRRLAFPLACFVHDPRSGRRSPCPERRGTFGSLRRTR